MPDVNDDGLNLKLQRLIETIDIANLLTEPLTKSIVTFLEMSAAELNAAEASVLIRDGDDGELRFLVAIGQVAEQLLNMRIPAGKGIAGFVFSSGQPMAVSDVGEEQTFYAEVDKETGFSTQMILATPLAHNGEVIGVLEYVNRTGDPPFEPFTPDEMDKAGVFANAVASLVNAYESAKLFRDFSNKVTEGDSEMNVTEVREWLTGVRNSPEHREMLDLAVLVREIASRGDAERRIVRDVLESILRYSDEKGELGYLSL